VSTVKLTVNGMAVSAEVDRTLLVHLLRENLNLTGTHVGCDARCGRPHEDRAGGAIAAAGSKNWKS
jgi:aerobic-type carbon monoxide dehydrogenase small subunit (CoxS/CutS family)